MKLKIEGYDIEKDLTGYYFRESAYGSRIEIKPTAAGEVLWKLALEEDEKRRADK